MTTLLLADIGNTHTHLGVSAGARIVRNIDLPTRNWSNGMMDSPLRAFIGDTALTGVVFCSVVPVAARAAEVWFAKALPCPVLQLTHETIAGVGIDYPKPESIGADRLANAVAVHHRFGAPSLVVDFGTAVTFDVVDRKENYVGGIIAPGLSAMTDYLHEKTALLPRIEIRDIKKIVGKSTEEAMLIGAVHGYRGLVRELISGLKKQLQARKLPVVATGGYARLIARGLPEITAVDPLLTLHGLRLVWNARD